MSRDRHFDFWYAVNNTEIVALPARHLETFGTTILNYHLVSELMDAVNQVRIREGRMQASQPKIVAPEAYAQVLLEGFGEEARHYIDWLREHEKEVRILQYGYALKQESFQEHIVTDNIQAVVERVRKEVRERNDPLGAVVVGVDEPWDVCLVKLFWEVIRRSAGPNLRQMMGRGMLEAAGSPRRLRDEIEAAFLAASRDPRLIPALGKRLHDAGLFEDYQDRFFSLLKSSKQGP